MHEYLHNTRDPISCDSENEGPPRFALTPLSEAVEQQPQKKGRFNTSSRDENRTQSYNERTLLDDDECEHRHHHHMVNHCQGAGIRESRCKLGRVRGSEDGSANQPVFYCVNAFSELTKHHIQQRNHHEGCPNETRQQFKDVVRRDGPAFVADAFDLLLAEKEVKACMQERYYCCSKHKDAGNLLEQTAHDIIVADCCCLIRIRCGGGAKIVKTTLAPHQK
mmetsp:Transcript_62025/g.103102  ORF Transcript_62025/g.103102 Transcript_62025/m.103102 type:complete len:221 (-) Transcript_62025:11-673(-)